MKNRKRILPMLLAFVLTVGAVGCSQEAVKDDEPITVVLWHYYNGDQQNTFDLLVEEFNKTVGAEQGITVVGAAQGSVADLESKLLASINGDVGAEELPNIFASYSAAAYTADRAGLVVDLSAYMTEEELSSYVPGYLADGDFSGEGEVKMFPIAKSTEVLVLNETDWNSFAAETGVSKDALATFEGLVSVSQKYYEWTDAKTPDVPSDGRAFFGRDSMANYLLVGAKQLGVEIFGVEGGELKLDFDKAAVRKLWDHYYVPYVKGYFGTSAHFRSDDLKTGTIISYVGSSAGALYIPDEVSISDTESYPIEVDILPAPQFAGGIPHAVQQGANMVVTTASEEEIRAAVEFLKWFTEAAQNLSFSINSGYLPVKVEANSHEAVFQSGFQATAKVEKALSTAIDTVNSNDMYSSKAFRTGAEARADLEAYMRDIALNDRALVLEKLAGGASLEEATAEFCSDAYFESWYAGAKAALENWEAK